MARLGEFWPAELIAGRVVRIDEERWKMANGGVHGAIRHNVNMPLGEWLREHPVGRVFHETGVTTKHDPDQVRFPDLCYISNERIGPGGIPEGNFPISPDLAIEVVSPTDRWGEVMDKVDEYLAAETLAVWVIDPPSRSVTVFRKGRPPERLVPGGKLSGDPILPGLEIDVARIFEGVA